MKLQPGIDISCNGRLGTLGLVLKKKDSEKYYLLSCWHVIDGNEGSANISIPSLSDQVVATYQRSMNTANEQMDCAIAEIDMTVVQDLTNQIFESDKKIKKASYWQDEMPLVKTGAATGRTSAKLLYALDNFGNLNPAIKIGQLDEGEELYCQHGDSGAIWCSLASGNGIAMHSKGGLPGNEAAAVPLKVILQYFNASILLDDSTN